jgi:hypothetical protein
MRKLVLTALSAAVACACSEAGRTPTAPSTLTAPLVVQSAQPDGIAKNHRTHLSGDQENLAVAPGAPTPADSQAQGQAIFQISDDKSSVDYKLIASNIDNAFMAHIHIGPATGTGPIAVWLYPGTAVAPGPLGSGRHDGVLAEGTFTAANFIGPLAGHPMADLIAAIEAGNAYVNVHTNDGVGATNTGPGDFPGGEIRGQLGG